MASPDCPQRLSSPDSPLGWTGSLCSAAWAEPPSGSFHFGMSQGTGPWLKSPMRQKEKALAGVLAPPVEPQRFPGGEFNPCKNLPERTMLSTCPEAEKGGDPEGTRRGRAGTVASQQTRSPPGPPPASTRLHAHRRARLLTPNSSSCFICLEVSNFLHLPKVHKTLSSTKSLFPVSLLLEVSCHFLSYYLLGFQAE